MCNGRGGEESLECELEDIIRAHAVAGRTEAGHPFGFEYGDDLAERGEARGWCVVGQPRSEVVPLLRWVSKVYSWNG